MVVYKGSNQASIYCKSGNKAPMNISGGLTVAEHISAVCLVHIVNMKPEAISLLAYDLAESEPDKSLPIMDSHDKSLFWALFIMI